MGDFNLNLLNSDSHPVTNEFINSLGSYLFVLIFYNLLTRLTNRSATLIDNI